MTNTLFTGDNLYILNGLDSQSIDLIYLDPPFNSKRIYSGVVGSKSAGTSFKDVWSWGDIDELYLEKLVSDYSFLVQFIQSTEAMHGRAMMSYITYMAQRLIEMHRVLKDTGSLYLHVDSTASHYLKIILDRIFGEDNFVSEIIWHYGWGSRTKNRWSNKNDNILMYVKGKGYCFNALDVMEQRKPEVLRRLATGSPGATMSADKGKSDDKTMALPTNVWYIPTINAMSKERVGYPTQKPLELLRKIIKASSNEGDLVLDPFCGCATTCVASQQLQRRWIGIDIESKASEILIDRLSDDAQLFKNFIHRTDTPERSDQQIKLPTPKVKEQLYKEHSKQCNGCLTEFDLRNLAIDHIIPKAKGGGNYYDNYQLLCVSCNRIKGNRPMEYLKMKIKKRTEILQSQITFG